MTYEKLKNNACIMITASKTLEAIAVIGLNTCEDETMGDFLAHIISPALILYKQNCITKRGESCCIIIDSPLF